MVRYQERSTKARARVTAGRRLRSGGLLEPTRRRSSMVAAEDLLEGTKTAAARRGEATSGPRLSQLKAEAAELVGKLARWRRRSAPSSSAPTDGAHRPTPEPPGAPGRADGGGRTRRGSAPRWGRGRAVAGGGSRAGVGSRRSALKMLSRGWSMLREAMTGGGGDGGAWRRQPAAPPPDRFAARPSRRSAEATAAVGRSAALVTPRAAPPPQLGDASGCWCWRASGGGDGGAGRGASLAGSRWRRERLRRLKAAEVDHISEHISRSPVHTSVGSHLHFAAPPMSCACEPGVRGPACVYNSSLAGTAADPCTDLRLRALRRLVVLHHLAPRGRGQLLLCLGFSSSSGLIGAPAADFDTWIIALSGSPSGLDACPGGEYDSPVVAARRRPRVRARQPLDARALAELQPQRSRRLRVAGVLQRLRHRLHFVRRRLRFRAPRRLRRAAVRRAAFNTTDRWQRWALEWAWGSLASHEWAKHGSCSPWPTRRSPT